MKLKSESGSNTCPKFNQEQLYQELEEVDCSVCCYKDGTKNKNYIDDKKKVMKIKKSKRKNS